MIKVFFRHLYTLISTTCCQLQGTSSLWILDQRWALPLDPTEASSQTILQARSTTLAQILPSYIIPSRSLWSSSTTISAPLRNKSIATSTFFHPPHHSDVWDISCPPMFSLPRHCKFSEGKHHLFLHAYHGFTTLTIKVEMYYSIIIYHVVHLTRSSPEPTISWFLHSRYKVLLDTGACANAELLIILMC